MNNLNLIKIGSHLKVSPNEVTYLKADENYTTIHFSSGKKIMVAFTLKSLATQFEPFSFFRVHKSQMVNVAFIKEYDKRDRTIEMKDNKNIEVARRRAKSLVSYLKTNF
jgi:two-component system, LytTR family, response regulator